MLSLSVEHQKYLESRGYTPALMHFETVMSTGPGQAVMIGGKLLFKGQGDGIMWVCRSASGTPIGAQVKYDNGYRWYQMEGAGYLPIMYATSADYDILYNTGNVTLVEGVFDRIAIKRLFPERAVIARLSKGVGKQLAFFLRRYANTIWTAFDMDEAGQTGTQATKKYLPGIEIHTLTYPAKDPSKLLETMGDARMKAYLNRQFQAMEP